MVQALVATAFALWVCGLLVPRDLLPRVLELVPDVLPLSYAVDAMRTLTTRPDAAGDVGVDVGVLAAFAVAAIAAGSLTLRRRTP